MEQISRTTKKIAGLAFLVGTLTLGQSEGYCLGARHVETLPKYEQRAESESNEDYGLLFYATIYLGLWVLMAHDMIKSGKRHIGDI